MTNTTIEVSETSENKYRPLRVWPVGLLLIAMVALRFSPSFVPEPNEIVMMIQALGPLVCAGLIVLWWLLFSRARWFERLAGVAGIVAISTVTSLLVHPSMQQLGMMFLATPMGLAAFGIGTVICRNQLEFKRTMYALLLAALGFSFSMLLRTEGMWSDAKMTFFWRWTPSAEQLLVAEKESHPKTEVVLSGAATASLASPEWPAFRGADRSGRQTASNIGSDWSSPPNQLWKIPVGPGWSSFSVAGELLFTQEQRGKDEVVVCYDASSGKENWVFAVETRFEEAVGGPGPRSTPTLATIGTENTLIALGANGALVRLNPLTGKKIWQAELQDVAERTPPTWGFSSSPLVVDSKVIVHAGGKETNGTLAFDVETGELLWSAKSGDHTYASPQLSTVLGKDVVLMVSNDGLEILNPDDGTFLLDYAWKFPGYRVLQPLVINEQSIVIGSGLGAGTRRISLAVSDDESKFTATEMWTSMAMKPDFNDFIPFEGHLYGFDGAIFTCIDLETGERKWKGGRYGKGQVLLLEGSGQLLVAAEKGDVVILKASPIGHQELGRFPAIEGKTWNHPVVVGDRLFIRNAEEAACFQLPTTMATE